MLRKFACAVVALGVALGSVFADEVKGTFVKFADGTLTLKVDDKEKEYKIPTDLKNKNRKGEEVPTGEWLTGVSKFKPKLILTVDGDKVTAVKMDASGFKGKGKDKKEEKKKDDK